MKQTAIGIGKKLRQVRIYSGMTQQELADRLGTTKAAVSAYEKNKIMPNFAVLIEIARILNVSTDYLLSFGDEYLDEKYDISPLELEPKQGKGKAKKLGSRFMGIGKQVKELREEKGLSCRELAEVLSVSVTTINKYENDTSAPSYEMLLKMAKLFNVTTERLFGIDSGRKLDISGLPQDKQNLIKNIARGMK